MRSSSMFYHLGLLLFSCVVLIVYRVLMINGGSVDFSFHTEDAEVPFYYFLYKILPNVFFAKGWISAILSFIMAVFTGLLINRLAIQQKLIERTNYYPVIIFILLSSITPLNILFSSHWIAIGLSVYLLYMVVSMVSGKNTLAAVFNIGLLSAVVFLLHPSGIIVFPLMILSMGLLYRIHIRFFLLSCLGFFTPFFYIVVLFFLTDNMSVLYQKYVFLDINLFDISSVLEWPWYFGLFVSCLIATCSIACFYIISKLSSTVKQIRNMYQILIWYSIVGVVFFLLLGGRFLPLFIYFPASMLFSIYIERIKRPIFSRLYISALILPILIHCFFLCLEHG